MQRWPRKISWQSYSRPLASSGLFSRSSPSPSMASLPDNVPYAASGQTSGRSDVPLSKAAADIPLVSAGLDRAAHHRRDLAWLDAAFASDRARILVMREGLPLVQGSGPGIVPAAVGSPLG